MLFDLYDAFNMESEGLAVGEVWYYKQVETENGVVPSNHAINILFFGPKNFVFIEPQSSNIIELTIVEQQSIYFMRFVD